MTPLDLQLVSDDDLPKIRPASFGMGGHHGPPVKDEWLTPPALLGSLGKFDLDPCSPIKRPWDTAENHFTIEDDGLSQKWKGRVWLNPPYTRNIGSWMERMAEHNAGTALVFARTETEFWHVHIWRKASAILFIRGRINFHHVSGKRADKNSGAPSALIAYGPQDHLALYNSGIPGRIIIP